ncbi:MAG: hypothetical protein EHM93_02855 [Bacteroidales bacterium]|nr:MAG: hypothetical protein EHM93_02855 [Bacteroidales bacterium]
MDRRKFLSSVVRGSILVGLTATSGYLITRKGESGLQCNLICNGCKTLPICTKPEAIEVKREATRTSK